ncbi:hypothetical protein GCK32_000585 [Trichostrongylus colubriformis]|uniref:Uncharacterized protein n=1 Tax=Trichostrongylus colubriformis TaxID=6319 RepID=A0AAN8F2R6_TRICO
MVLQTGNLLALFNCYYTKHRKSSRKREAFTCSHVNMSAVPGRGGAAGLLGGLTVQHLAELSNVLAGQHGIGQAHLSTLANPGVIDLPDGVSGIITSLSQPFPILSVPSAAVENNNSDEATAARHSLPWPVISPVLNVPHFDLATYRTINLDVSPSRDTNGFDLPLTDVATLRFFFNLGVQYSHSLAATQLYHERIAHAEISSRFIPPAQTTPVNATHVHQFTSAGLVPKPIAIDAVSCDPCMSPRPPPVDPTPPRLLNDVANNISDTSSSMQVHQQAQTSPLSQEERGQEVKDPGASQCHLTQNAREHDVLCTSQGLVGVTSQGGGPKPPASKVEKVIPVSQTLFQVSEQHFSDAFNASCQKSAHNAIEIVRRDCSDPADDCVAIESSSGSSCTQGLERRTADDKPPLAPTLMMTYLSNCMNNIKSTLNTNGLPIGIDANGRAVDYSSRPIDPIFQQARARMENAREFREVQSPGSTSQISSSSAADCGESVSTIATSIPTLSFTGFPSDVTVHEAPATTLPINSPSGSLLSTAIKNSRFPGARR